MKTGYVTRAIAAACVLASFSVAGAAGAFEFRYAAGMTAAPGASFSESSGGHGAPSEGTGNVSEAAAQPDSSATNGPNSATQPDTGAHPRTPGAGSKAGAANGNTTGPLPDGNAPSAVAPVPEPGTFAMIGLGLTLMGFVARRRSRKDAA